MVPSSANKNNLSSNCFEKYLLQKISMLESTNKKQNELSKKMIKENNLLKKRVESLNNENREFESKYQKINQKDKINIEELNDELLTTKEKLKECNSLITKLESENEKAYSNLTIMELKQSKDNQEAKDQMSKLNDRIKDLEVMIIRKKEALDGVRIELDLKKEELEETRMELKKHKNSFTIISQINKSNQSRIRSLENEKKGYLKKFDSFQNKYNQLNKGIESIAEEIKESKISNPKLISLINEFVDIKDYHDNLSVDSEIDQKLDLNKSLKEIEEEFRNKEVQLDLEKIQKIEKEIKNLSDSNIEIFEDDFQDIDLTSKRRIKNPIITSFKEKHPGMDELFSANKKKLKKEKIKALRKINLTKIRNEITEQIDYKIKTRSMKRKNKYFFPTKSDLENNHLSPYSYKKTYKGSRDQVYNKSKSNHQFEQELFQELDQISCPLLTSDDISNFKNSWKSLKNISKYIIWIIYFFEYRFKNTNLKLQTLESENGKIILKINKKKF
jgi:chromosome segregation ATPase